MLTDPLDIFQEGFTPKEKADAKLNAVEADRKTPAVNDIKTILNRIIQSQTYNNESWDVLVSVLGCFPKHTRAYIYSEAMKLPDVVEKD